MRFHGPGRLGPAVVMVGAAASATFLFAVSPLSRAEVHADCSASSPCPTPTPTLAFLTIDVTSGDVNTQITVNGGAFLANEQMTLYWDTTDKVAGGANADSSGNFVTHVRPFAGDAPGVHKLCASVQPNPCANFTLTATAASPSPSPETSPTPSPEASPSPTASAIATPSATPVGATLNGFDVISRPPLVFLPIAGALAILLALGYWLMSVVRRPRPLNIPATAVVHRASRPDYSAGFGTPPPAPAAAPPPGSAWDQTTPAPRPAPATEAPPPEPPLPPVDPDAPAVEPQAQVPELPPPAAEPELPPVDWDLTPTDHPAGPDDPLDFPEPGEDY